MISKCSHLAFLFIFLFSFLAQAGNCDKKETLKNTSALKQNLVIQNEQITKILDGEKVAKFTPQAIFGHGFTLAQTEEKINVIEKSIKERNGIASEYDSLVSCLNELKLEKNLATLIELSGQNSKLKIRLLKKNKELGDSLRKVDIDENSLPELREKIDEDTNEALSLKKELEVNLINSETKSINEKSAKKRELLSFQNELTRLKIEYLERKLNTNKVLEEKIKLFESFSMKLKNLSAQIKSDDVSVLSKNFKEVEEVWLSLAKGNYYDLFWASQNLDLAKVPDMIDLKGEEAFEVEKQLKELKQIRTEILQDFTEKKTQEIKLLNQLVTNSNSIRSSYYQKLGYGYFLKSLLKLDTYYFFKSEVTTTPYRIFSFFYKKFLYVREKISLGKEGYVTLFSHCLMIILIIIVFFTLRIFYSKADRKIDSAFYFLFEKFRNIHFIKKFYTFWIKVKDNTAAALWLVTLHFIRDFSYFSDLLMVIRCFEIILLAGILSSVVKMFLGGVSRLDIGNFLNFKKRAEITSNKFRNIFLFYFLSLLFIEATVGKVYSFTLIYSLVLLYTLYQIVIEASNWEVEFTKYAEKMFAGVIVEKYMRFLRFFPQKLRALFLLFFIFVFQFFDLLINLTENFEISKKISANLFKRQVEKVEVTENSKSDIPDEYKDFFSPRSLSSDEEYVENGGQLESKIQSEIDEWLEHKSEEHSLAIYGDKGIGKTTLLRRVERLIENKNAVDVIYIKVPSKVLSKAGIQEFISSIFKFEAESFDIYRIDKGLERKTVVILDEAQNIFLSQTGGFDAYHGLMNIINMNTDNLFWVMSFNKYSWLYLDQAFGRTKFIRNVFEVKGWSDSKIKELIMKRHKKSQFKLSYDLLINATRSQDEIDKYASIESKFFKLLWELSRGNPRSALYLWLSALSRRGGHTFNVNIPKEVELDGIDKLPDDLLFVISALLKHENLTSGELEATTNLPKGLIRNAIKLGLEKSFFFKDERARYMIDISTQYGLIKYLRLKNFIYGV